MERVKGIEPSYSAWKAAALPLSYTRVSADPLTRQVGRLNHPLAGFPALNRAALAVYSLGSINNERR